MTETDNTADNIATTQDWMADSRAYEQRRQSVFPENRTALFDALERSGITAVTVNFDGCGDSGQIEDITASPDTAPDLCSISVAQKRASWNSDTIATVTIDLRTALENVAYALLEDTHDGWEINEGAFGEFTFDVETRAITLDYNERFESSVSHAHQF